MPYRAAALAAILALSCASVAEAQSASPLPSALMYKKVHTGHVFTNPGSHKQQQKTMNGQGCMATHVNAAQTAVNPITGKMQAAPIVSIPLTRGGGSVASATTRAQQSHACAHART